MALPILLAMLAFSVQYGNALKVRNSLDIASRDAARYLARAPLATGGASVDSFFTSRAQTIISDRIADTKATIASFSSSSNTTEATVDVTIDVPFPLLAWLGLFDSADANLAMSATESWARTGDTVVTTSTSGGS